MVIGFNDITAKVSSTCYCREERTTHVAIVILGSKIYEIITALRFALQPISEGESEFYETVLFV